jgi:mono/diheme cytochrome c family protein
MHFFVLSRDLLDKQTPQHDHMAQRLVVTGAVVLLAVLLALFGIHQFIHSDPYIQSVLSLPGDSTRGQVIFQLNCAGCHGLYGDGQVGPSLRHVSNRKSHVGLIHQVTSGKTPPMPQFQPNAQEMSDLLKYLETL